MGKKGQSQLSLGEIGVSGDEAELGGGAFLPLWFTHVCARSSNWCKFEERE